MAISAIEGNTGYAAVCQGFVGAGLSGEALLLFTDINSEQMASIELEQANAQPNCLRPAAARHRPLALAFRRRRNSLIAPSISQISTKKAQSHSRLGFILVFNR